jgi:Mn2+/Fe2+ NRAMP family transporter
MGAHGERVSRIDDLAGALQRAIAIGFTRLIRLHFGRFWLVYHLVSLSLENLLMLVTEFIGMTGGLIVLGLPLWTGLVVSFLLASSIIIFCAYWTRERTALFVGAVNLVFVALVFVTRPSASEIGRAFLKWNARGGVQKCSGT